MNLFRFRLNQLILVMAIMVSPTILAAPQYASEETRRIIENMVEAHGGLEAWREAPSISFDAVMHDNYHANGLSLVKSYLLLAVATTTCP